MEVGVSNRQQEERKRKSKKGIKGDTRGKIYKRNDGTEREREAKTKVGKK